MFCGRDLGMHPLYHNEICYSLQKSHAAGVGLFFPILGQYGSSTRSEVLPGILALSCPMPVRMGADSANFIKLAISIVDDPDYRPPKP